MAQHPEHDRLNETIRSWYTASTPEMGYEVERGRFGFRGIARHLISATLADASARGCHWVLINADENDMPIQLYRRLGFVDEVYWRRHYRLLL